MAASRSRSSKTSWRSARRRLLLRANTDNGSRKYIKEPLVTVIVENFVGPIPDQVRIIGEAAQPRSLPYRADMTVLDAMIAVGGLTRYAAGNDSVIVRTVNGQQNTYAVHLADLIRDGDISSNVALQPGDIVIIPQRLF